MSIERISMSGRGAIDHVFRPAAMVSFKLVYVRVHFRELESGSPGTPNMTLSLDSALGDEFNVDLFVAESRGINADANIVVLADELADPSSWSFVDGDGIRVSWPAADESVGWGIEVGVEQAR